MGVPEVVGVSTGDMCLLGAIYHVWWVCLLGVVGVSVGCSQYMSVDVMTTYVWWVWYYTSSTVVHWCTDLTWETCTLVSFKMSGQLVHLVGSQ